MNARRLATCLVAAVGLVSFATTDGAAQRRQCKFNAECSGLLVCYAAERCREQCRTDRDCLAGHTCRPQPNVEFSACVPKQRAPITFQKLNAPERLATLAGGGALYGVTRAAPVPGPTRLSRSFAPGRTVVWSDGAWRDVGPAMPTVASKKDFVFGLDAAGQLQRLDRTTKTWSPIAGGPAFRALVPAFDAVDPPGGVAQPPGTSYGALYGIGQDGKLWYFKQTPDRFVPVGKESAIVVTGFPRGAFSTTSVPLAMFIDETGNDKLYVNDDTVRETTQLPPLPAGTRLAQYEGASPINGWALDVDGALLQNFYGAWERVTAPTFTRIAVLKSGAEALVHGLDEQGYVHVARVKVWTGYNVGHYL